MWFDSFCYFSLPPTPPTPLFPLYRPSYLHSYHLLIPNPKPNPNPKGKPSLPPLYVLICLSVRSFIL